MTRNIFRLLFNFPLFAAADLSRKWAMLAMILMAFMLVGCSAPRAVGLYMLGVSNTPLPPESSRTRIDNYPFVSLGDPYIGVTVESKKNVAEVLAFYRRELAARGWQEPEPEVPVVFGPTYHVYNFVRSAKIGTGESAWEYSHEELTLDLTSGFSGSQTHLSLQLRGRYAWDAPSRWIARSLPTNPKYGSTGWLFFGLTFLL